jgi:hypothetical protein
MEQRAFTAYQFLLAIHSLLLTIHHLLFTAVSHVSRPFLCYNGSSFEMLIDGDSMVGDVVNNDEGETVCDFTPEG